MIANVGTMILKKRKEAQYITESIDSLDNDINQKWKDISKLCVGDNKTIIMDDFNNREKEKGELEVTKLVSETSMLIAIADRKNAVGLTVFAGVIACVLCLVFKISILNIKPIVMAVIAAIDTGIVLFLNILPKHNRSVKKFQREFETAQDKLKFFMIEYTKSQNNEMSIEKKDLLIREIRSLEVKKNIKTGLLEKINYDIRKLEDEREKGYASSEEKAIKAFQKSL
jgi:hypothetical protein